VLIKPFYQHEFFHATLSAMTDPSLLLKRLQDFDFLRGLDIETLRRWQTAPCGKYFHPMP